MNGETFEGYNQRRWGSSGWTRHLKQEGRKDQMGADFRNWKWWPNTFKAHQLVHYFTDKQVEGRTNIDTNTCNTILFKAIYEEGLNISNVDTLVNIGMEQMHTLENSSLEDDKRELESFLRNNDGGQYVQSEIEKGRMTYDISGVPYFIVESVDGEETNSGVSRRRKPYALSGAQPSSVFLEVFQRICDE